MKGSRSLRKKALCLTRWGALTRRLFIFVLAAFGAQQWRGWQQLQSSPEPNRVIHVGQFGLGHRLSKLSAAAHLAGRFEVPILQVQWDDCHRNDLFGTLFGRSDVPIQPFSKMPKRGKKILVRNDVNGYYAGQAYKNFRIPIDESIRRKWEDKLESDQKFFGYLRDHFSYMKNVLDFQKQHGWDTHHVVGVHIRAGNGESGHFAEAQRNTITDRSVISQALQTFVQDYIGEKPLLVFVATDTIEWVDILHEALTNTPVVSLPQVRVEQGNGVSFSSWKNDTERCLAGWVASASDMFLLAASNTLIATTRSTFTQILPLPLVLSSNGKFCELRADGRIACFRKLQEWLFNETTATHHTHKVMVHLPDIESNDRIFDDAKRFLWDTDARSVDRDGLYYYGRKYNPKYRERQSFQSFWTLVP